MKETHKVGIVAGFCIAVGNAIGGGLWVNPVVAASVGGPILLPLLVLAILPVMLAIPGYAMLVKVWPVTPGHYYYLTRFLYPNDKKIGKFFGWSALWPWAIISVSVAFIQVSLGGAGYLSNLAPFIPFQAHQVILVLFTIGIVWFGLRVVGWVEIALVSTLFLCLIVMFVLGMANMNLDNFTPFNPYGYVSAAGAAALVAGSISNGFFIIDLTSQIRDSRDSVPKILFSGLTTNAVVVVLIVLLAISIVPASQLSGKTLVFVTEQYLSGTLGLFPIIGAILAGATTTLAFVLLFNRYCIAGSREGILPDWVQKENQHGEPKYILFMVGILSIATILVDIPVSSLSYGAILAVMSLPLLTSIASLRFTYEYADLFEKAPLADSRILSLKRVRASSMLAIIFMGILFIFGAVENPLGFALYAIAFFSGVGIFTIRWMISGGKEIAKDQVKFEPTEQ